MIRLSVNMSLNGAQGKMALDVACQIDEGVLSTFYGASGAGKTTLLRLFAGLTVPERGHIEVGGQVWLDTERKINVPPQERNIGFVFQDYALFPNMTVMGNLEYALGKKGDKKQIDEIALILDLGQFMGQYPATLSGGQKQRVALARALVRRPKLLLLDEPLSALDNDMRSRLQDHILTVHRAFGLTTILVSHDVSEIYKMSDHIFVLDQGHITKEGRPQDLFTDSRISGKFQMPGEILSIEREDIIYVITVLVHNNVVKVVGTKEDIITMRPGDKVLVSSKAFNPIISKMEPLL